MPIGTSGNDLFNALAGREAFDGGSGQDTVSYASSTSGIYANLSTGRATPLLKIMPFGDSITYGVISSGSIKNEQSGGYRQILWNKLTDDDLSLDYVGGLQSGPSSFADRDNQGLRGQTIDYLNSVDEGYLATYRPDVLLLMIGTNDTKTNTAAQMIAELRDLVRSIATASPTTTIFVSTIPPIYDSARNAIVNQYNALIPGLVEELNDTLQVHFVDMTDLTINDVSPPPGDSGVHPTAAGFQKIAQHWYDALTAAGVFERERDTFSSIENFSGSGLRDELVGDGAANVLSGLAGDDTLLGLGGNDVLDGGDGYDRMEGGAGDDTYLVNSSSDVVVEKPGEGNDTIRTTKTSYSLSTLPDLENLVYVGTSKASLSGNPLNNRIEGGTSSDSIDGKGGADQMVGGTGNDTYTVDDAGDTVLELANGGTDLVRSSVTFALSANVENLTLTGTAAVNGTGNDLVNTILGNAAANILMGYGGNDILNGGAGADQMIGGAGGDSYTVDDPGDQVIELSGEGTDTVTSSATFTLGANVEHLTLAGSAAIEGVGNASGNTINGNAAGNRLVGLQGNDTLNGLGGDDRLEGGDGNDVVRGGEGFDILFGGTGSDRFDWDASSETSPGSGRDQVLDFVQGSDKLDFARIDANSGTSTNDTFAFIGTAAFSGAAGQIRYQVVQDGQGTFTLVQGDVNGDRVGDFEVALINFNGVLTGSDFLL